MSPPPHLVVRTEGGEGIGFGHLTRGLALIQAWNDAGGTTTLASKALPPLWAERFAREGVTLCDPASAPYSAAVWTVLDGYQFSVHDQEAIVAAGCLLLVIDDHGSAGRYVGHVVLDQNLGATAASYELRSGDTELLLGPRYALLRREFYMHPASHAVAPIARRLLVSAGGSPSELTRAKFEAVVADPLLRAIEKTWLVDVEDVAAAMAEADIALAASGTTCWELCCTALPAVLLAVADNQIPLAARLSREGAAEDAGPVQDADPCEVAALLSRLSGDAARRAAMSDRARRLVDGRGARRVTTRMRSALLNLRPACPEDATLLWEWANDPIVRATAFSTAPIAWETHIAWFLARLDSPTTNIFLAFDPDDVPVGVIRFEGNGITAEVSVALPSNRGGQGWGSVLIDAGVRRLFEHTTTATVVARIKPENRASISDFDAANFVANGQYSDGERSWAEFVRHRDRGCEPSSSVGGKSCTTS